MKKHVWLLCSCIALLSPVGALSKQEEYNLRERQIESAKSFKPDKRREANDFTGVVLKIQPCNKTDILDGVWKLVYFNENPPSHEDRAYRQQPQQYISFHPGMYYSRVRSRKSVDDAKLITNIMQLEKAQAENQKFFFTSTKDKAELVLMLGKKTPIARYGCSIVQEPKSIYKKNDMILNGYSRGGKTILFELYRRWF